MKRLLVFAFFLASTPGIRAGEVNFIRVEEDTKAAKLETAVTHYEKNGVSVDLIGAIHIGDKAYYQALNQRFTGYEVLLFEMIGGETIKPGPQPPADPGAPKSTTPLRVIYAKLADMLDLTGQVDQVNYHAQNFIHADLTLEEFSDKQTEKGESILKFLFSQKVSTKNQPNPLRLMLGLLAGRADLMKLSLIGTLGHAEDQVASLAGDSVIIGDRNARCLQVLADEVAAGRKKIGIFYGAAHFPDMDRHLIEQGYTRGDQEWLTAWNVLKPIRKDPGPEATAPQPAAF